jgi:hypothetical protein
MRSRTSQSAVLVCCAILCALLTAPAFADTFGSGANQFEIEFVPIGNPGNPDDTTDPQLGKVEYAYRMGKYEISEDMIDKANALGGLSIEHDNRGANKPATSLKLATAMKFVNWLNTSTGHARAYNVTSSDVTGYVVDYFSLWSPGDAGYNPNNPYRNRLAKYVLPSADEWHKAAYYDPVAGVYYDYATGSDTVPTGVASGTAANTAVYGQSGPADIMLAGGLSPYGTMGQQNNVSEWEETAYDLSNGPAPETRAIRGGEWFSSVDHSPARAYTSGDDFPWIGFRVASVPEPSTALLAGLALLGSLTCRRRLS